MVYGVAFNFRIQRDRLVSYGLWSYCGFLSQRNSLRIYEVLWAPDVQQRLWKWPQVSLTGNGALILFATLSGIGISGVSSGEVYYPFRFQSFTRAVIAFAIFSVIADVGFGMSRSPVADRWQGNMDVNKQLFANGGTDDIRLDFDLVTSGYIYDKRPVDYKGLGFHLAFSGKDVQKLRGAGVPERFISAVGDGYEKGFCRIQGETEFSRSLIGKSSGVNVFQGEGDCPRFRLDFQNFDRVLLTVEGASAGKKYKISGFLDRDSRIPAIQRLVMKART